MSTADAKAEATAPSGGVGQGAGAQPEAKGLHLFGLRVSWGLLLGTVPIYIGLIAIWIYFDLQTDGKFLGARNLSNMVQQYSYKPVLALGIVLVLLLGEIDLSVGYLTQLSAVLCATFITTYGWPSGPSIALTLALCMVAGLSQGALVAWVRMPSFVVTLGGFLIFEGIADHITGPSGIGVYDPFVDSLGTFYLPNNAAWVLVVIASCAFVAYRITSRLARLKAGVSTENDITFAVTIVIPVAGACGLVALLNHYIGVPIAFVILSVLVATFWWVARRMRYGRHIYAVGGNLEASRRAGINTTAIRWTVFGISGLMAGVAGVMLLGYSPTASTTIVTGDLLLDVISIAVIGGVSLTGGRGSVWSVLLGALVIGSVDSGLALMDTDPYLVSVVKGSILLLAILLDVLGKRFGGVAPRR
jgi:D-xylose transport system permease protein